jgi:hypothetical protein
VTRDELLELSDERELWLTRLLDAERAAYMLGYADGRADEACDADRAWAAVPVQRVRSGQALAELEVRRWELRGDARTRETFGNPHPDDYTGGPR